MDEFQAQEETSFVVDDVTNVIKEIIDVEGDQCCMEDMSERDPVAGAGDYKTSVEGTIGGNAYQHNKVNQWTSNVVEQCLNQLTKLGKPFKYIVTAVIVQKSGHGLHIASSCFWDTSSDVTCVIMQKNGAGLHTASSCFWDNSTDGSCTVRWENKTMYCIVSVFGLAI